MKRLLLLLLPTLLHAEPDPTIKTPPDSEEAAYPAIERFIQVMETIRARHPDIDRLTYDRLVNHALEGMLSSLDPHSSYIHPEMAAAMKAHSETDPFIASLGLTVGLRDSGPYVAAVTANGPADQAKLLANSSIIRIDGKEVANIALPELTQLLNQAAGKVTAIIVKSPVESKPYEAKLIHQQVSDKALTHAEALAGHPQTGYLRLAQFSSSCAAEVEAALDELEDNGIKSLILDLRGNPGGDINATVQLLALFLPVKTEVVSVHTRDPQQWEYLFTADKKRRERRYPVVVLIDRMSASASELTAGCLQELKRATVIGEVSYGKGSVQNIIPMNNGTALRLTIATYHMPSGSTPHGVGITPDHAITFTDLDRKNFLLSLVSKNLPAEQQKALRQWQDPAIAKALVLLNK